MRADRPSLRRIAPWLAYLAAGVLGLVLHASLETGSLTQSFLYDVIGASAIVVALIGVWMLRPDRPTPWLLMAFGQPCCRGRPQLDYSRHRREPSHPRRCAL